MALHSARRTSLLSSIALIGLGALAGCSAESTDIDASEADLTKKPSTVAPLLADVLSGGDFRCAQTVTGDIRLGGDVTVHVAPAGGGPGSWRSPTTLAGAMRVHSFTVPDPSFTIATTAKDVSGTRSLNVGDIGHGYYCGGGVAAYHCGPDRTDTARFYVEGGALRCQVMSTQNEVWSDHVTYSITAAPIRLSACFDETYYLAHNPDVAHAVAQGGFRDGRDHFDKNGRGEGRVGCACEFDEAAYLAHNPDVAAAVAAGSFLTGRHHYARNGAAEGRAACP